MRVLSTFALFVKTISGFRGGGVANNGIKAVSELHLAWKGVQILEIWYGRGCKK